jgi:hypothetical protein
VGRISLQGTAGGTSRIGYFSAGADFGEILNLYDSPKYGEIVRGIDFGGTSKVKQANPKRAGPYNRRAEMYGDLREWIYQGGSIPDDDDLASDISGPKQKFRANNDWLLESKTELKARGIRSPDLSDACALTFATKEWFDTWAKPKASTGFETGSKLQHVQKSSSSDTSGNQYGWMG